MKLTDEIKQKMDNYFNNVSDEQFFKDLKEANNGCKSTNIIGVGEHTLKMWHALSFNNKVSLQLNSSKKVSCFYCCKTYTASKVTEYTNPRGKDMGTAICPYCSIDSVIPMEIGDEELKIMNYYYFELGVKT